MKISLIVEENVALACGLQVKMKLIGYIAFIAKTPAIALRLVKVMSFNVVLISKPTRNDERRSFAGEIRSSLPGATIILITECNRLYNAAKSCQFSGVTAVLRGPASLSSLWRVIEFEQDGFGCHPGWVASSTDRRAKRLLP